MKKSNKNIERIIRESIDIDSRDFFEELPKNKLSKTIAKNNKYNFYLSLSFSTIFIIAISLIFFNKTYSPKESKNFDIYITNVLNYDYGDYTTYDSFDSIAYDDVNKDMNYIINTFHINKLFVKNYNNEITCRFESERMSYCNLSYYLNDDVVLKINLSYDNYQLFDDEIEEKWNVNSQNGQVSKINDKEFIVINDLNKNLNYKTKFKHKDVFVTIETFNINENTIFDIIKQISKE